MAMPAAAAAAVTSGSRTLPPGWATARTPAAASASTPSGNGKKASLPAAAPWARSPALATAIRTESTRLCWPAPTPTTRPSLASTIAFDFTLAATDQARARSAAGLEVPAGRVVGTRVGLLGEQAAGHRANAQPAGRAGRVGLDQPQRRLAGEHGQGLVVEAGGDHDLGEDAGDPLGGGRVQRPRQPNHPAEGADRVALQRAGVRLLQGRPERRPARVGVLDDGRERPVAVLGDQGQGGVGIEQVVVGQLLACQLPGRPQPPRPAGPVGGVERRPLVRVLPVPQRLPQPPPDAEPFGEPTRREGRGHPAGDGGVVGGGAGECLGGEVAAFGGGGAAGGEGGLDLGVVGRVADDGDPGVVLGGGPHHGGAADVDALDGQGGGDVGGGDGLLERVEVNHDQVEGGDAGMLQLGPVAGLGTVGQEAGVDPGVEGLDSAVEELGEAGQLLDPGDGQAVPLEGGGGGAGGDDLDPGGGQGGGQAFQALLVEDADQGPADGQAGRHRDTPSAVTTWARRPSTRTRPSASRRTARGRSRRSSCLIRSWRRSSSSLGSTGTAAWNSTGPWSTSSSTRWTVQPVTLTP